MPSSPAVADPRPGAAPPPRGELRIVTDAGAVDRGAWQRFVAEHPRGTAFQRPEMMDVYAATRRDAPVFAAAVRGDGALAALMLGTLQRSLPGPLGALTARVVVWGGPLVDGDDPGVLAELLRGYQAAFGRRAVYTQFRHLWDVSGFHDVLAAAGFRYEAHLDVLVDLTLPAEESFKRLKHFRRKNVKRAEREGVEFRQIERDDEIALAHEYIRQLYARIRLPLPHASHFDALARVLRPAGVARYFGAYHGGRLIAARIVLCHDAWIYDFWAGADEAVAELQGGTVLPWAIMRWGAENGYRVFDFGGAGKPDVPYGVRDFKLAYGGDLVCFGRHTRVQRPAVYRLGETAIRLLRATARARTAAKGPE